ncbi:MAG TPA: HAD family hydrolase [Candidatus Dormibacteraeota bacterium]|nr:HAD family hydrolase [Candidatus Dormibacteraeota bacterium]
MRLVAVDLDGTIVRRDRTVSPRVRAALQACAARDIPVVVATARRWVRTAALVEDLGLRGHCIVAGGGAVRRIPGGHVEVAAALPRSVVAAAVRNIDACGLQPMVGAQHGEVQLSGAARRDTPTVARYLARGATRRVSLEELAAWPATRVLAMGPSALIHAAARRCTGLGRILVQDAIFTHDAGGERVLELHVMKWDKGNALHALCTQLGIPAGETLVLGDAPSDLPMLEIAGIPVVMGQAEPGMKRRGWTVAPSVLDDGAAWAIERFALGG